MRANQNSKKYSFIIIGRNPDECAPATDSLSQLLSTPKNIEVLIATGSNPSAQRNQAAQSASGDYLVFLDNDSVVDPRLLIYFEDALTYDTEIGVVGGPALHRGGPSVIKTAIQSVFVSVFGLGPFRSRYLPLGQVHPATEENLILCNLLVRRDLFIAEGGFNVHLYPNEENEFLNRVQKKTKMYYHPLAICYREPRESFAQFCKQMFRYGEGRARDLAMFPKFWNHIFLLPLGFSFYLISLLWAPFYLHSSTIFVYALPALVYAMFDLSASVFAVLGNRMIKSAFVLPALFLACHFFYGLGLAWGFVKYPFSQERLLGIIQTNQFKAFGELWPQSVDNIPTAKKNDAA